jgi:hypothetical protein
MGFMEEEPSGERKLVEPDVARGGARQRGGISSEVGSHLILWGMLEHELHTKLFAS